MYFKSDIILCDRISLVCARIGKNLGVVFTSDSSSKEGGKELMALKEAGLAKAVIDDNTTRKIIEDQIRMFRGTVLTNEEKLAAERKKEGYIIKRVFLFKKDVHSFIILLLRLFNTR